MPAVKTKLHIDKEVLKKIKLVAVAYSHVDRDFFPTEDAYIAEKEVEERARQVMAMHGIEFEDILASLLSKHAESPERPKEI